MKAKLRKNFIEKTKPFFRSAIEHTNFIESIQGRADLFQERSLVIALCNKKRVSTSLDHIVVEEFFDQRRGDEEYTISCPSSGPQINKALEDSKKYEKKHAILISKKSISAELDWLLNFEDKKEKELPIKVQAFSKNFASEMRSLIKFSEDVVVLTGFDCDEIEQMERLWRFKCNLVVYYDHFPSFTDVKDLAVWRMKAREVSLPEDRMYAYYLANKSSFLESYMHEALEFDRFLKNNAAIEALRPISDKLKNKDIFQEIDSMIGMNSVKKLFRDIAAKAFMAEKMAISNYKNDIRVSTDTRMHAMLTGNPGTGKTTIARMYANFLHNAGLISENKMIEVSANDIVSHWIGGSIPKTKRVLEKAKGGVLFIDEAYSLTLNSHGEEALSLIVKEIESPHSSIVVVFAGYEKEMNDFIHVNSGLGSRIPFNIQLPDYSSNELFEIMKMKLAEKGFEFNPRDKARILSVLEASMLEKNSGNGRLAENLAERLIMDQATKLYNGEISEEKMREISVGVTEGGSLCAVA